MPEKTDLVPREEEPQGALLPVARIEDLVAAMRTFEEVKRQLLTERDLYDPDGKGERIRKSGWRKLALAFGLSDEIVQEWCERDMDDPSVFRWDYRVRVRARDGRTVEGVGSASSKERHFAHPEHEVRALAHTRAKSRAIADMLGSGDLIAEELEEPSPEVHPAARASQSEGFKGPGPSPPTKSPDQHQLARRFLTEILGEDLMRHVRIEEREGVLWAFLARSAGEELGARFAKQMLHWGYGVTENQDGWKTSLGMQRIQKG